MDKKYTAGILGTGSYVPLKRFQNDDLSQIIDTSDEWIRSRTGIEARHVAVDETVADMATKAAKLAVSDSGIDTMKLDLIIAATSSAEDIFPGVACYVQSAIEAPNAFCFDMNAACSGFIFAMNTAYAYIASGMYENVLVVGGDKMSLTVDWADRGTCVLFGDGAGAVVIGKTANGIITSMMKSDGSKGNSLTLKRNYDRNNLFGILALEKQYINMDGREIFKFACHEVAVNIEKTIEKSKIKKDEIKYYILHQANERIITAIAKRLEAPMGKFPLNLAQYGNTSAASIPILVDELNKKGNLKTGDKLVLAGYGAGLSWGTIVLEWI